MNTDKAAPKGGAVGALGAGFQNGSDTDSDAREGGVGGRATETRAAEGGGGGGASGMASRTSEGAGGGGGGVVIVGGDAPDFATIWATEPAGGGGGTKLRIKAERERYMKEFGLRAKLARGSIEVNDAAAAMGVHRNTIWNIERGDTLPDAFELALMAGLYHVSVECLVGGGSSLPPAETTQKSVKAIEIGEMVYVPHFDMQVSAGPGAFHDIESVIAMRGFDRSYIRGELRIAHNDVAMCYVTGRSALPELKPRDTIMVDLRDRSVTNEGLHVVRLDDTLILKRLQRLPGRVLRVTSSNPEYEPFDITAFEESQRDFEVIGRVRWAGITYL